MEQIAYLPNLIALIGVIVILIWQSINTTTYARQDKDECEEKLDTVQRELLHERIKNERLTLLLSRGFNISGGSVTIQGDAVGGNKEEPQ